MKLDRAVLTKSEVRRLLWDEQSGKCFYCQSPISLNHQDRLSYATIDHVQPRSGGGNDKLGNLVLACWGCNQAKSDMDIVDFMCNLNLLKQGQAYAGDIR